jgi:hypothetical protein
MRRETWPTVLPGRSAASQASSAVAQASKTCDGGAGPVRQSGFTYISAAWSLVPALAGMVAGQRLGWTVANRHHRVRGPIDAQESRRRLEAKNRPASRQVSRLARLMDRPRAERDTIINFASQSATRPISSCADQATLPPADPGVQIPAHGAPTRGHVGPREVGVLGAVFAFAAFVPERPLARHCPA